MKSNTPARPKAQLNLEQLEDRALQNAAATFDNLAIDPTQYDSRHIIVALRRDTAISELSAVNPAVARIESAVDLGDHMYRVELAKGTSVAAGMAYFQMFAQVRYAQPDFMVSLTRLPNDASFTSQWGLNNTGQSGGTAGADISADEAWNVTTGSGRTIVAVIDTGVDYTHPDLIGNIWSNSDEIAGNGRDDDRNGFVDDIRGWDFANNDNNPMDDNGHGTHVAGVIGAVGNNGVGVAGVNWRVQIMPLKFLGASGSGSLSNAIRALNYAVANGATISNNSYGGGGFYQAFYDAVNAARAAGHIFVASAGNDGLNTDNTPAYPASYNLDNIVSVAATDRNNGLATFSNFGSRTVDIGAPGVSVYSTYKNGSYAHMSGTSMASPFVAGAAALIRDLHPDWSYRQVINQILNTGDALPSLQGKTVSGKRLNLARAIGGSNVPVDAGGPKVTAAVFSGANAGSFNKVRVTFSEAVNASTFTAADVVSLTRNGQAIANSGITVTAVSGTNNQFDVSFAAQTTAGAYALTFGPDIRDQAGNAMNQNGNSTNGESVADRYTATATLATSATQTFNSTEAPKTIADLARTTSTISVGQNLTISRISVKLSLNHTYDGDLQISLRAPSGQQITLFNRRGGSADNINTVFDDRATTPIGSGAAPFTGWFKPEQALSAFNGINARGTWTLIIDDVVANDTGRLNSWSITIEGAAGAAAAQASAAAGAQFAPVSVEETPIRFQAFTTRTPGILRRESVTLDRESNSPTNLITPPTIAPILDRFLEAPPEDELGLGFE